MVEFEENVGDQMKGESHDDPKKKALAMADAPLSTMMLEKVGNFSFEDLKQEAVELGYDPEATIQRVDGLIDRLKKQPEARSEETMDDRKLTLYEISHREIMDRLKIRGLSFAAYFLAMVAVFVLVALVKDIKQEILFLIPFLALRCSFMFSHHNEMIGARLSYCRSDLEVEGVTLFEHSAAFRETVAAALESVTISYLVATGIPSAVAIGLYLCSDSFSNMSLGVWSMLVVSSLCFVFSQRIILRSYELRTQIKLFRLINVDHRTKLSLKILIGVLLPDKLIFPNRKLLKY